MHKNGIEHLKRSQEYELIKRKVIVELFGAIIQVLQDEFGFGKVRIDRFLDRFNYKMDCIRAGTVKLDDFKKELERMGIKV